MNMQTLSCKELGNRECEYIASGGGGPDVKRQMLAHASKAHPGTVETLAQKDALGRRIDQVLADRGGPVDEDESQGGEFVDDNATVEERSNGGSAGERGTEPGAGEGRRNVVHTTENRGGFSAR
jgi:predicted small metal-binding protein